MILPEDSEFHENDPSIVNWTETNFVVFSVPQEQILVNAYVVARPNIGVALSSVVVSKGICTQPYQIDYMDPQMHQPCPESMAKYTMQSGLSVEVTKPPVDYHFTYEGYAGTCRFDVNFRGLMQPFDMHDPKENPLADPAYLNDLSGPGLLETWSTGHMDLKGHVTGELELRGKRYEIDCYHGMDRSWGPRSEDGRAALSWLHVTFGEDFGVHLAMDLDMQDGEIVYTAPRFGYVMDHGQVYGVTEAAVHTNRVDMLGMSSRVEVTDVRGKHFEMVGTIVGAHPWYSYNPCRVSFQSLYEYRMDGEIGYGESGDIIGLDYLGEHKSRHARL